MKKPTLSRSKNKILLGFPAACVLVLVSCLSLPTDPTLFEAATLQGVVFDGTSRGVQGFLITLDDAIRVSTDINGKFTLPSVTRGPHRLAASKLGHEPVQLDFNFNNRSQIIYVTAMSTRDYLAFAEASLKQSDFGKAQLQVEKALALTPKDPVARYLSALIKVDTAHYDQAFSDLLSLLDEDIHEQGIYLLLIDIAMVSPVHQALIDERIARDPYVSQIPAISRALKRLENSRSKE